MITFRMKRLPTKPSKTAFDCPGVRVLLQLAGGELARFKLAPGGTSRVVTHRTVDEIWYFLRGRGKLWRRLGKRHQIVDVEAGVYITLPVGTQIQFQSFGYNPLVLIGNTMPPRPGEDEV